MKKKWLFFLICSSLFVACTKVTIPEPSENPVLLSYEAQMKQINVKDLHHLERECSTDKRIDEDNIIENDWVRFSQLGYVNGIMVVQIDVKENTTSQPRSHKVKLLSRTDETILTVTQAGKP